MILKTFPNRSLRVALDIDDTILNFRDTFADSFPEVDLSKDHLITKKVFSLRHSSDFWENLPLLEMPNFEPTIYSTKRVNDKKFTRRNLAKLGLPIKPIYQTYNQSGNKVDKIKGRCDVLIDDSIFNVRQALAVGFPAILISRPHNMHEQSLPRIDKLSISEIIRVYNDLVYRML